MRVGDQDPLALGQDRVVSGVPRDPEALGHARHGQVLTHDRLQRPPQPAEGELRPPLRGPGGVLAPHVPTAGAPVAAHGDLQRRGTPAQRLMGQPPHHAVTRGALASAAATPVVRFDHPARQDRAIRFEALPGDLEPKLVQTAEGGQVRTSEGSFSHVEVFPMGSVRTPSPEGIDPHPRSTHAPSRRDTFARGCAARVVSWRHT